MKTDDKIDPARIDLLLGELRLSGIKLIWTALAATADKEGWPAGRHAGRRYTRHVIAGPRRPRSVDKRHHFPWSWVCKNRAMDVGTCFLRFGSLFETIHLHADRGSKQKLLSDCALPWSQPDTSLFGLRSRPHDRRHL
jgi:hypothetical protein